MHTVLINHAHTHTHTHTQKDQRIRAKTDSELSDEQAGFTKGRGTRDQITNLPNHK